MRVRQARSVGTGVLALTVGLFGCSTADESAETAEGEATAQESEATAEAAAPGADAAELWAALADADYQGWDLWPGKGRMYAGTQPHGMLLTAYLNPAASDALASGAPTMPDGAIIVKENYMPDSTLAAITTMYKVEGFNPEAGDWYWVKYLPDGSVDGGGMMQGKVPGCIGCHGGQADNDYIYTSKLGGGN